MAHCSYSAYTVKYLVIRFPYQPQVLIISGTMSISVNTMVTPFLTFLTIAYGKPQVPWIAGGQDAKPGDFPFLVFLLMSLEDGFSACTGSIIHPDWILTAGHCTHNSKMIEVFAAFTLKGSDDSKVQERKAAKYYPYPGVENPLSILGLNTIYDYSLIKLEKSLDINNDTVTILNLENSYWEEGLGRTCTAAGFGRTPENLERMKLHFMEAEVFYGSGACPCASKRAIIHSSLCFITGEERKSLCPGDSGGPLICDGRLVGVASYLYSGTKCDLLSTKPASHFGCGVKGTVSVYAYVSPALNWIRSYVGDTIPPQPA